MSCRVLCVRFTRASRPGTSACALSSEVQGELPAGHMTVIPVFTTTAERCQWADVCPDFLSVGATNSKRSSEPVALCPPGPVTVMSTVPLPAGTVAVIAPSPVALNVAAVPPKSTAVTFARCWPEIVSCVPDTPECEESPDTTGIGCSSTDPMSLPSPPAGSALSKYETGR